jgi:hypothetical protein
LIDKKANFPASVCAAYHLKLLGADEVEMLLVFFSETQKDDSNCLQDSFPIISCTSSKLD